MYRIYACATFTIVATDGLDAEHGLRGFKDLTVPRKHSQEVLPWTNSESFVINHSSYARSLYYSSSTYYSRAWTFQEEIFSKRKLLFWDGGVEWRCGSGLWHEGLPSDTCHWKTADPLSSHHFESLIPTCSDLMGILDYNVRELRFPEDAYPAFAGTQSVLERLFQSSFNYGVPEFWFDIGLLWTSTTLNPRGKLNRRIASRSSRSHITSFGLPSWSWLGWHGMVVMPRDAELRYGIYQGFTESVTTWYSAASPQSLERKPIMSDWHKYRSIAQETHLVSLAGWEAAPDGCGYRHPRAPHDSFSYTFPFPDLTAPSSSTAEPQNAFLFAKTNRSFLSVGKSLSPMPLETFEQRCWLTDSDGRDVGYLQLHEVYDPQIFNTNVELVAICKGYSNDLFNVGTPFQVQLKRRGYPRAEGLIDCYFVLWIEWVDGVAYRKASGAVVATAWEELREKELVDLILG